MRAAAVDAARGVLLLLGLLIVVRLLGMASVPLMDTTEARYAEIGRKMAQLSDWVTLWYDWDVPYWGKPPLSFWPTAASFQVFGINEFAARLPHFVFAALVALLVWRLGAARSRRVAALSLAMLVGSALFYVSAGAVMTDMALALGTTLAMFGFWRGVTGNEAPRQPARWLLFIGLAVGLLAKGPVALLLLGIPLVAWTLVMHEAGAARKAFPWAAGSAWLLVLVVPWYVLAELRTPGFLNYFLFGEHWHRFVTPGWSGDLYGRAHRVPPGTIWFYAFQGLLPWSVLLPVAALWWRTKRCAFTPPAHGARAWHLYLVFWTLTPLIFFTAARNIIWTYVLPAVPATALLAAEWLSRHPRRTQVDVWLGGGLAASLVMALAFGINLHVSGRTDLKSAKAMAQTYQRDRHEDEPLVFVGSRPYSASFYSRGTALHATSGAELATLLPSGRGYVAVCAELKPELRKSNRAFITLGRFGHYDLLRVDGSHSAADTTRVAPGPAPPTGDPGGNNAPSQPRTVPPT